MGWIHSRLWGIVCGTAAPVLPEQGHKQPRVLKVHEFQLTDTVSDPGRPGGGAVPSRAGFRAPAGLTQTWGCGPCRGCGGGQEPLAGGEEPVPGAGAGAAAVPGLVPLRVPVPAGTGGASWSPGRGRVPGARSAPAQKQIRFPVSDPSAGGGINNPSVALKEKTVYPLGKSQSSSAIVSGFQ